jgi:hypothetical protein
MSLDLPGKIAQKVEPQRTDRKAIGFKGIRVVLFLNSTN